jgi:CopG family transcriptional regulator, nickel-responsive regulator
MNLILLLERDMQRITMTLDDELVEAIDRVIDSRGYQNRSEAIRDLARAGIGQFADEDGDERNRATTGIASPDSVAALVYVYDHETRELAKRLTNASHNHHDLTVATLHVHLDHRSCMEVAVLLGPTDEVRHVADHVIAERGVRHGRLTLIPVTIQSEDHRHGSRRHPHDHIHVRQAG